MKNLRVLIAQKKDKSKFKIQEYKHKEKNTYTKDTSKQIYEMYEKDIINDLNNNLYRTLNEDNNKFTEVISKYYESIDESHLVSIPNNTTIDNINNLEKY